MGVAGTLLLILQQQDQKRRYVLDALREVCCEMGWSEERAPVFEDPLQLGSALLYKLDTSPLNVAIKNQ